VGAPGLASETRDQSIAWCPIHPAPFVEWAGYHDTVLAFAFALDLAFLSVIALRGICF